MDLIDKKKAASEFDPWLLLTKNCSKSSFSFFLWTLFSHKDFILLLVVLKHQDFFLALNVLIFSTFMVSCFCNFLVILSESQ